MLERLVQQAFTGSRLLAARPLEGGMSARASLLEAALPGGERRRLVARCLRDPRAAQVEFRTLQAVHARGLPAPRPLFLDEACMLLEYVEGAPDFSRAGAAQLAELLAQVHAVRPSAAEFPFLGPPALECAAQPFPSALLSPKARSLLSAACSQLPPLGQGALLHGDFWPGNVLWQGGNPAALIDWEDAALGDPLYDLCIARLDILCIFGEDELEAFTRRYTACAPLDFAALPLWDLNAALRLARLAGTDLPAWTDFYARRGRPDITPQCLRERFCAFTRRAWQQVSPGSLPLP